MLPSKLLLQQEITVTGRGQQMHKVITQAVIVLIKYEGLDITTAAHFYRTSNAIGYFAPLSGQTGE